MYEITVRNNNICVNGIAISSLSYEFKDVLDIREGKNKTKITTPKECLPNSKRHSSFKRFSVRLSRNIIGLMHTEQKVPALYETYIAVDRIFRSRATNYIVEASLNTEWKEIIKRRLKKRVKQIIHSYRFENVLSDSPLLSELGLSIAHLDGKLKNSEILLKSLPRTALEELKLSDTNIEDKLLDLKGNTLFISGINPFYSTWIAKLLTTEQSECLPVTVFALKRKQ